MSVSDTVSLELQARTISCREEAVSTVSTSWHCCLVSRGSSALAVAVCTSHCPPQQQLPAQCQPHRGFERRDTAGQYPNPLPPLRYSYLPYLPDWRVGQTKKKEEKENRKKK